MFRKTSAAGLAACGLVIIATVVARADDHVTLLRSEKGRDTQFRLWQFDGGHDAKYVVAFRTPHDALRATGLPASEWLWPTGRLVPTDIVYDCTEEVLHGKAKPILCDLSRTAVRVFAILPTQVERIEMLGTQSVGAGQSLAVHIEFHDAGGKRLCAMLPFHVALFRPDGVAVREIFLATQPDGTSSLSLPMPLTAPLGRWRCAVRSQLNGLTASLPVEVTSRNMVDGTLDKLPVGSP